MSRLSLFKNIFEFMPQPLRLVAPAERCRIFGHRGQKVGLLTDNLYRCSFLFKCSRCGKEYTNDGCCQ
jgi:hypothetical protein